MSKTPAVDPCRTGGYLAYPAFLIVLSLQSAPFPFLFLTRPIGGGDVISCS